MLAYWASFLLPSVAAIVSWPVNKLKPNGVRAIEINALWVLVTFCLIFFIGFRFEVGGDWGTYLLYLYRAQNLSFADTVKMEDPGYWTLNLISNHLGLGIAGVNTLGAAFFSTGLVVFCRSLPRPWLALACAMPYLVIVVAMGYTRQSIALGAVMLGLVMLGRQNFFIFCAWVLVGALFHKSAVVLIPIAALTISKNRFLTLVLLAVATLIGYFTLLADGAERLVNTYTDANLISSGALVRLAMNAVPGLIFFLYREKFLMLRSERKLWSIFAFLSISMLLLYFPTSLSTALDRMALYIIPLQLVVFSYLPDAIGVAGSRNQVIVFSIIVYYSFALFVWLQFGGHAHYWLPYRIGFG